LLRPDQKPGPLIIPGFIASSLDFIAWPRLKNFSHNPQYTTPQQTIGTTPAPTHVYNFRVAKKPIQLFCKTL
jgi:hypothetical protein